MYIYTNMGEVLLDEEEVEPLEPRRTHTPTHSLSLSLTHTLTHSLTHSHTQRRCAHCARTAQPSTKTRDRVLRYVLHLPHPPPFSVS